MVESIFKENKLRERTVKSIDEILDISFGYLKEHGLENTSIRDLAQETGMSLGSIYYWFESKDDLIINSIKYGLSKSSLRIFSHAFETIGNLEMFIENIMNIINEEQKSLRIVFQAATSPIYGDIIRKNAQPLNSSYDECIEILANNINASYEEVKPVVYLFVATVLDYVVWDDYKFSKSQLEYLYSLLLSKMNTGRK